MKRKLSPEAVRRIRAWRAVPRRDRRKLGLPLMKQMCDELGISTDVFTKVARGIHYQDVQS